VQNGEIVLWMSEWPIVMTVMVAQNLLNLKQGFSALGARFPLPEDHKSLSANAAPCLRMFIGASTNNLHDNLSSVARMFRR
jgi:hypothetical protein